jgi:hypothetical protein
MKESFHRFVTSRWFIRFLSLFAFAAIGGSFALNALAFDTDDPAESAWGTLNFFDGSTVTCQLTDANSLFVGSVPNVIIAQVGPITCSHIPDVGPVQSGLVTLSPPGITATQVTAGSCKTDQKAGTSVLNFASQCGTGADVTFKFTWISGPLAGQTYQGGGVATLTTPQCNTQFPATAPFAKGQLVSAQLSYEQKNCQGPEHHSTPFNFRTCTDSVLNNSGPATCIDVTHVGTASLIQFRTVTADTRDSVNSPGCPGAAGVLKVTLNGADLSAAGFSAATVNQNSFTVGPPDNPFLFNIPAPDVVFGPANPFQQDGISDVQVTFPRCIGQGGTVSVIDNSGFVTVTGLTLGTVSERFAGSAQAKITSGN